MGGADPALQAWWLPPHEAVPQVLPAPSSQLLILSLVTASVLSTAHTLTYYTRSIYSTIESIPQQSSNTVSIVVMDEVDRDISDKLFGCDRDMRNPVNLEHDVVFLVGDDTQ